MKPRPYAFPPRACLRSIGFCLCAWLCIGAFLSSSSIQAQGCLDATVYLRADITSPLSPAPGVMYAFRGDEYSSFDWSGNEFGTPGPWRIALSGTEDLFQIDAAFPTQEGSFFLISQNLLLQVNQNSGNVINSLGLNQAFPNLPPAFHSGIDAAWANASTQAVTLIKGDQRMVYFRNMTTHAMTLLSGPTTDPAIATYFPEGIDAAVYHPGSSYLYYQSGNQYLRIDTTGQVSAGYPLVYTSEWGDFPGSWSCIDPIDNSGTCELGYQLPDEGCGDASHISIAVSGLAGQQLGSDIVLEVVKLQIDHTFLADLRISLTSPSGATVLLTDQRGGGDDDYGVGCGAPTIFRDDASLAISQGSAPFANTYRPEEPLSNLHDGSNPNGTWQLQVCDLSNDDIGTLNLIQLEFAATNPSFTACNDPRGGIQLEVDWTAACQGGSLANSVIGGMNTLGFHAGGSADVNEAWGTPINWDDPTAVKAQKRDADHFVTYIPDVEAYFGLSEVNRINFLFNQGIDVPGNPWGANLKDFAPDNNCRDYFILTSDITETCTQTTRLQERQAGPALTLAPNPLGDRAVLSFDNPTQKPYHVELYSLTGQRVRRYPPLRGTELVILRGDLPAGLYLLTLHDGQGQASTIRFTLL